MEYKVIFKKRTTKYVKFELNKLNKIGGVKMEFVDVNTIKGEMDNKEFLEEINKIAEKRDISKYGRDGRMNVYSEEFKYKNIPYLINIVRYYQIGVPLDQIKGFNPLGKWATLEYPNRLKKFVNIVGEIHQLIYDWDGEFLWRDTVHSRQENWTLKQMIDEMHEEAKKCIDKLDKIESRFETFLTEKNKEFKKLRKKFLRQLKKLRGNK